MPTNRNDHDGSKLGRHHKRGRFFRLPTNPARQRAVVGFDILTHGSFHWYEALTTNNGGDASDFARLFVIPGMTHCSGGCATDQFDALSALVDWVENGTAPDQLVASLDSTNAEIPDDWDAGRTRPLCGWPKISTYVSGDIEDYQSFEGKLDNRSMSEYIGWGEIESTNYGIRISMKCQ